MHERHIEYARSIRASLGRAEARKNARAYVANIAQRTKHVFMAGLAVSLAACCGLIIVGLYGSGWGAHVALALAGLAAFMGILFAALLFHTLREADCAVENADEFVESPSRFVRAHRGVFL